MKSALIVLDIQNVWLDDNDDLKKSVQKRMDVINDAIGLVQKEQTPYNRNLS